MVGTLIKVSGYEGTLYVGLIQNYLYHQNPISDEIEVGVLWSDGDISTEFFAYNINGGSYDFLHDNRWINIHQNFNKFTRLLEG